MMRPPLFESRDLWTPNLRLPIADLRRQRRAGRHFLRLAASNYAARFFFVENTCYHLISSRAFVGLRERLNH